MVHDKLQVDSVPSQVQHEINTQPGRCPVSDGRLDGGDGSCPPDLVGSIPNSRPGLPPLLEVQTSVRHRPHAT